MSNNKPRQEDADRAEEADSPSAEDRREAMVEVQEEAAEEREKSGGYQ